MTKTINLEVTECEFAIIQTFLHLTQQRAREPTINKITDINAHSIANNTKFTYKGVRKALKRLHDRLKD